MLTIRIYMLALIVSFIMFSCTSTQNEGNASDTKASIQKDDFVYFIDKFRKKGVLNIEEVNSFTNSKFSKDRISSIESIALLIENEDLYCVLFKVNCLAGGECEFYYLSTFNKKGLHLVTKKIGETTSDNESGKYFNYKVLDTNKILVSHELEIYSDDNDSTTFTESMVEIDFNGEIEISDN